MGKKQPVIWDDWSWEPDEDTQSPSPTDNYAGVPTSPEQSVTADGAPSRNTVYLR